MHTLNPYLAPILAELEQFFNCYSLSTEYQIITHLQKRNIVPFADFSLANSKDLFSAHFLCMHALYHLKKQYQQEHTYQLIIQSVQVERVTLNGSQAINEMPASALATNDPLESYYLNSQHYFDTQEDEINDLLKSFWQKYIAQDNKQAALAVLELPIDANAKMVKTQYLKLAQKHHPDKGGCAELFSKIQQAKSTLDKAF